MPVTLSGLISGISENGCGFLHARGMNIEVAGTVPGDFAEVEIIVPGRGKRSGKGKLVLLRRSSPERIPQKELCPYQAECGGCAFGLLREKAQLALKRDMLGSALKKAGIKINWQPQIVPADPGITRFKSIRYFGTSEGRVIQGFYHSESHIVENVAQCPRECAWFGAFASEIASLANENGVRAYDEISEEGVLRSVMMRDCQNGETMAVLSYKGRLDERFVKELTSLSARFGVKSFWIARNDSDGNRVICGSPELISGERSVKARLGNFCYSVGPLSFLQVNYPVAERLYSAALEWCGRDPDATALDLCCGAGAMTLPLSRAFGRVIGVEIIEEAVEAAKTNAMLNGVTNADFIASDLNKVLPDLIDDRVRAVIADPSRRGLGAQCCQCLWKLRSGSRVTLIFCGLKALERDLYEVMKGGFIVRDAKGFDMFPGTSGLESLVLLEKK